MAAAEMELVRIAELVRETPTDHWGVLSADLERGERLVVQHCEMEPGGGAVPHAHADQDQMFVVVPGRLNVRDQAGHETDVRAGEAMKIPAGAVHGTENRSDIVASYFVVTYPAVAGELRPELAGPG